MQTSSFRVKTAGRNEQFSNYNAALRAFEKLKKEKSKDSFDSFKITLESKDENGKWSLLDSIDVKN